MLRIYHKLRQTVSSIASACIDNMRIFAIIMLTITTASCTAGERITGIFGSIDRTAPEIVEYDLLSSGTFYVLYSEEVVLDEVILGETGILIRDSGTSFRIVFPFSLETGTEYTLFITAKDACGNTQRTAFFLTGPNDDVPEAVINEISPEAPDRVEILILEDGNTAGMVIKDGAGDNYSSRFLLPPIDVKENDIILIYWNGDAGEEAIIREDGAETYVLEAGLGSGLTATNAPLILYKEEGGAIIDGIVYTTGDAETAGGYGNMRTAEAMHVLMQEGQWKGLPVPSEDITSSRVLARRPGGYDTDTRDDWFTTAPRSSTFGLPNTYLPYQGE